MIFIFFPYVKIYIMKKIITITISIISLFVFGSLAIAGDYNDGMDFNPPTILHSPHDIVCPKDAKVCQDGHVVIRVGKDCKFKKCPEELDNNKSSNNKDGTITPDCKKWNDGCNLCSKSSIKGPVVCKKRTCPIGDKKLKICYEYFGGSVPDLSDPLPNNYNPTKCNKVYTPVCADKDGKKITYFNSCLAHKVYAKILYKGKCGTPVDSNNDSRILGPPIYIGTSDNSPKLIEIKKQKNTKFKVGLGHFKDIEIKNKENETKLKDGDIEVKVSGKLELNQKTGDIVFQDKKVKLSPSDAIEKLKTKIRNKNEVFIYNQFELEEKNKNLVYKIKATKKVALFGLFDVNMEINSIINAETGQTKINTPWWSFLAF